MNENLKALFEMAKADPELGEKMAAMDKDELIALAKEKGIELGEEDFTPPAEEMGDSELENTAGGFGGGLCFGHGFAIGRDRYDGNIYGCGCALYGQGGDGRGSDANCRCIWIGAGDDGTQYDGL